MKSSKATKILWLISLVASATLSILMLKLPKFRADIMRIQFSCSAQDLCNAINNSTISTLYRNLCFDFWYILCYTLLFYYSLRVLLVLFKAERFKYMWLCLLPGLFDVAENMFMLPLTSCKDCLTDNIAGFCLFYWAVRLKWLTVVPFAIMTAIIAVYHLLELIDRIKSKKPA